MSTGTKKCAKCAREKHIHLFSKDRTRPSGRAAYCMECYALQVRGQRAKMQSTSLEAIERIIATQDGKCACCQVNSVSLKPGVKDQRSTMSFVDFRTGWGMPAGVLCGDCMPHLNTVKNSAAKARYLVETTLAMAK